MTEIRRRKAEGSFQSQGVQTDPAGNFGQMQIVFGLQAEHGAYGLVDMGGDTAHRFGLRIAM